MRRFQWLRIILGKNKSIFLLITGVYGYIHPNTSVGMIYVFFRVQIVHNKNVCEVN